jgi:hypothetical protein
MNHRDGWDWEIGRKTVCDLGELRQRYSEVHELTVSPDGERIAGRAAVRPRPHR